MGWARTVPVGGGGGGSGFVLTMSLLWSIVERFHPAPRCVRDLHLFCGPNSEKLVSNLAKRKRGAVGEREGEGRGGYPVSEAEQVSKAAGSACFQSNQMLVYIHTGTTSSAAQLKILKIYQNQLKSKAEKGRGREVG